MDSLMTGFYDRSSHVIDTWPVRRGDDGRQTTRRILKYGALDAVYGRGQVVARYQVRLCDDRLQRPSYLPGLHLLVQLLQHHPVGFIRSVLCIQENVDPA
jgi:hypothetical protein